MGMGLQPFIDNVLPFAVMVMLECIEVGVLILSKAALNTGISMLVYVVYYNTLGILILLPFFVANISRSNQPPITFHLLCRFFVLGLVGICLLQIFGFAGIDYSSPALGAAMSNLIPAFTFLLAIALRMETLNLRRLSSLAKVLGTTIAISGAFVIIFYKGPAIKMVLSRSDSAQRLLLLQQSDWVVGGGFLILSCICVSTWNVLQAATMKAYPDGTTVVFFFCFFGTIQSAIVALVMERNPASWVLQPGIGMISVVVTAVNFATRLRIVTWCLHKKGPVYVAMFKPISAVIAMISGIIFLGDSLYIGSIIGAATISVGFYAVIWGQAQEKKMVVVDSTCGPESSTVTVPLLQNATSC